VTHRTPTTARLRHDIDRGRSGDKVDVIDPAAAPLGTDEEAAGTPVPAAAVQKAYWDEVGSARVTSERSDSDHAVAIYLGVIVTVATSVGVAIWLSL
jgi:hypothetical protein